MDEERAKVIRRIFLRMLKENGILKAYVDNFNDDTVYKECYYGKNIKNITDVLNIKNINAFKKLLRRHAHDLLVNDAFGWDDTSQGFIFWSRVNAWWKYKVYSCTDKDKLRDYNIYAIEDL